MAKAAELVGGRADLARALQTSVADIDRWITEEAKPPREIFLRVVDIILDETSAGGADDTGDPPHDRSAAGPDRYVD